VLWTPLKIPNVSPITDFPYVYHIRFELEQIVDHAERIVDGVVVNLADSVTSPSDKGIDNRARYLSIPEAR
jgi:hypothetical protein